MCYVTGLVQGRKESHEVCYPANLAETDWPLKQLLLLLGGSYQTAHWQEYAPNRLSIHSFFHCHSTTLPRAVCSHSPEEGSAIFRRQQQIRQRGRYWRSRVRFHTCIEERRPYFPNQKDATDLIRDLGLTKSKAELLLSRLKQWNLLDKSVQVTDLRKRHETFSNFLSRQDRLCFCNNVTEAKPILTSWVAVELLLQVFYL